MSPEDAKQSRKFAHQSQSDPPENSTERHFPFAFAAQHYDLIIRLYKPMLKLIPFEKDHDANQRRLKRAFETLLLWGRQYEVSVGELDKLIDRSWRLRRSILRTLTSIGRTLIERLASVIQQPLPQHLQNTCLLIRKAREEISVLLADKTETEHAGEGSSDVESDSSSIFDVDSLSEIAEDLASNVENLMDIDALYDAAKENTNIYEGILVENAVAGSSLASTSSLAMKKKPKGKGLATRDPIPIEMLRKNPPNEKDKPLDYIGRLPRTNESLDTCLGFLELGNTAVRRELLFNTKERHVMLDIVDRKVILRHPESKKYSGTVSKTSATLISALVATQKVGLFATIKRQNYLRVLVYASRENCDELGDLIFNFNYILQRPAAYDQTTTYYNPHSQWLASPDVVSKPAQVKEGSKLDWKYFLPSSKVDELFGSAIGLATFKKVEVGELLKTKLKLHQLEALAMMLEKEAGTLVGAEFPPLWIKTQEAGSSTPVYYNTVSNSKQTARPTLCRGGLLADETGLGKTLTILALIVNSLSSSDSQVGSSSCPTLIVTSGRKLPHWEDQIKMHLKFKSLRFITYRRRDDFDDLPLRDYNIVLTTYEYLGGGRFGGNSGALLSIPWNRVVLDEAHVIRDRGGKVFRAAYKLEARHRWCVTATPIHDAAEDVGALIEFLRVSPFDIPRLFRRDILCSTGGRDSSLDRLRRLLQCISLRRTKGPIAASLDSPPIREIEHLVDLSSEERRTYDLTRRNFVDSLDSEKPSLINFDILLRLRQICNHGLDLLPEALQEQLDQDLQYTDPPEQWDPTCEACEALLFDEGLICGNLPCFHQTCERCCRYDNLGGRYTRICQLCDTFPIKFDRMARGRTASASDYYTPSSKVKALIQNLERYNEDQRRQGDLAPKSVVFSEWPSMLDLTEEALTMKGINFKRLTETSEFFRTRKSISDFRIDGQYTVLLATLRCASAEPDLTMASQVHLIEPGWTSTLELQALNRVHGLGQTKEVVVTRYIVRDSIEEYIRKVQAATTEMLTLSSDNTSSDSKRVVEDIMRGFLKNDET